MNVITHLYLGFIVLLALITAGFAPVMDYVTGEKSSVLEICTLYGVQDLENNNQDGNDPQTPVCSWCLAQATLSIEFDQTTWDHVRYASKTQWLVDYKTAQSRVIAQQHFARAPPLLV